MKTTLLVKRIDFWTQIAALIVPLLIGVFHDHDFVLYTFFILGGVQLASLALNWLYLDEFIRDRTRTACEWIVGILLIVFAICFLIQWLMVLYLVILLFVSPILAFWHITICYLETRKINEYVDREQYVKL